MPAKTALDSDKIDVPAACAVPFRPYCGGVVTRTRNVSEYMLVLAVCLVVIISRIKRRCFVSLTTVPYKEKPQYNSRRRTAASRLVNQSFLSRTGNNLLGMRNLSSSTPHLLKSRDLETVASSSVQAMKIQRPSYDSDSPYVDTPSGGDCSDIPGLRRVTRDGGLVTHTNKVALRRARLVLRWVTVRRYVTNHPGQRSLLPSAGCEMITGQEVLCSWEGNRRSAVALAMRHGLCGVSTYRINSLSKRNEHLAFTPL